jgi:hypothetical protein
MESIYSYSSMSMSRWNPIYSCLLNLIMTCLGLISYYKWNKKQMCTQFIPIYFRGCCGLKVDKHKNTIMSCGLKVDKHKNTIMYPLHGGKFHRCRASHDSSRACSCWRRIPSSLVDAGFRREATRLDQPQMHHKHGKEELGYIVLKWQIFDLSCFRTP